MQSGRVIIADDFGLGRAHDAVILDLLEQGAIDGTSVFSMAPMGDRHVHKLLELHQSKGVKIGLHLNLTEVIGLDDLRRSIVKLWLMSMVSGDLKQVAKTEFVRQVAAFQAVFGIAPDYIDGHQHCHAIPAFWPALHAVGGAVDWVRSPCPNTLRGAVAQFHNGGGKSVLVMFWGWRLRRRLQRVDIQTNTDFSGLIAYTRLDRFKRVFQNMVTASNCLTMVHPGAISDPMAIDGHDNQFRAAEASILKK